jgi:hypothetical protein
MRLCSEQDVNWRAGSHRDLRNQMLAAPIGVGPWREDMGHLDDSKVI